MDEYALAKTLWKLLDQKRNGESVVTGAWTGMAWDDLPWEIQDILRDAAAAITNTRSVLDDYRS